MKSYLTIFLWIRLLILSRQTLWPYILQICGPFFSKTVMILHLSPLSILIWFFIKCKTYVKEFFFVFVFLLFWMPSCSSISCWKVYSAFLELYFCQKLLDIFVWTYLNSLLCSIHLSISLLIPQSWLLTAAM